MQANLATYGIATQTPKEIEPIVICAPHDIVQVKQNYKNKQYLLTIIHLYYLNEKYKSFDWLREGV